MTADSGLDDLPVQHVTVNQIVAWNMAWFRKAAGLTQATLGERLGWPYAKVSAAERSWDGKRVREFDATTLITLAQALGVPLAALFLPPGDDGSCIRYVWAHPASGWQCDMADLAERILTDNGDEGTVMDAYRQRVRDMAVQYLQPGWEETVDAWMAGETEQALRETRVAQLRWNRDALRSAADDFEQQARALEGKTEES